MSSSQHPKWHHSREDWPPHPKPKLRTWDEIQSEDLTLCSPCDCECRIRDRKPYESMREWIKDCMCMHHWMQTDYYQFKLEVENVDPKADV